MTTNDDTTLSEPIDTTSVSMSAASSATMIGFSATIITLIVTLVNEPESSASIIYILIFYMLAIIFFIFTTEFFILAAWDKKENYTTWGTIGSIAYGLGLGWIIIGISLTFDILVNLTQIAYLTMTLFLLGYIIYYLLRWKIKKEEPYIKTRIAVRALMMLQIVIGYVALYVLDK